MKHFKLTSPRGVLYIWAHSMAEALRSECAIELMGPGPVFQWVTAEETENPNAGVTQAHPGGRW